MCGICMNGRDVALDAKLYHILLMLLRLSAIRLLLRRITFEPPHEKTCFLHMRIVTFFRYMDKENPSLMFSWDREIPTRGSTVSVGNEASPSFPLERWIRGLGFPGSTVHQ